MIYYDTRSTTSRKVMMTIDLLGLPLERRELDLLSGEHKQSWFLDLNPNGTLPMLVEDGFVLWESNAILQYLASKVPGTLLWPNDARKRADIARWQFWEASAWSPAIHILLYEKIIKQVRRLGDPDPNELARGMEAFCRCASLLDAHLQNRLWMVGRGMTLADVSLSSQLMYARELELPLARYPHLAAWWMRVDEIWQMFVAPAFDEATEG
jgi:glutathione S-transferase